MSDCYCTTNNTVHATYCPEYKYAWRDKRIEELEAYAAQQQLILEQIMNLQVPRNYSARFTYGWGYCLNLIKELIQEQSHE